jgi:hypothetical protein
MRKFEMSRQKIALALALSGSMCIAARTNDDCDPDEQKASNIVLYAKSSETEGHTGRPDSIRF